VGVEADAASGQPQADNTGKEMSLQDAISAALAASKGDSDEQPETTPEPKAEAKEADASVEAEAGEGRNSEDARKPETSQDSKDAGEAVKKDDAPAFEAPEHWSEAHRKAFAELDAKAKEIVRDLAKSTQSHLTRRSQELGDKARYADAVRSVIDDSTRNKLALQGANEFQYIQRLHEIQQFSERDPTGFVKWSIQTLGIKPEDLFPAQSTQPAQPQSAEQDLAALLSDPKVKELETKYVQLERQLAEQQQREAAYYQQQRALQHQGLQNVVAQFRHALDENGQLRHPHFDSVNPHMGALMTSDPQLAQMPDGPEKMQAAYEMAVWARPDLRQSLLEAETVKRVKAAERAAEVARAKAVTQIKPAPAVAATQVKPTDLSAIVKEQLSARGFGA
jgi:hypothetical protein